MPALPPGNAFLSDLYHMGVAIDKNIVVMYSKHEDNPYLIVVDQRTGERLRVILNNPKV